MAANLDTIPSFITSGRFDNGTDSTVLDKAVPVVTIRAQSRWKIVASEVNICDRHYGLVSVRAIKQVTLFPDAMPLTSSPARKIFGDAGNTAAWHPGTETREFASTRRGAGSDWAATVAQSH
jgi:hypothetical protein